MTSRYSWSNSVIPLQRRQSRHLRCWAAPSSLRRSSQQLSRPMQPVDELVDLLGNGVEVEARAIRRDDAELGHQRLTAVVTGANGDSLEVEDLRDVVRMVRLEVERDDPGAALDGRPVGDQLGHLREAVERVRRQVVLVLLDRVEAD